MGAGRTDTWMPLFIGDYLRDTGRLSTEGHGAYLLLIMDYWTSGGPLPNDDEQLAAITKLAAPRWRAMRRVLEPFFDVAGGVWRHHRVDAEIARATENTTKKSGAGKAGAEARWNGKRNGRGNAVANGKPDGTRTAAAMAEGMRPQWQNDAPSPSPSPKAKAEATELDAARPLIAGPALAVAQTFEAKHRELWPDFSEFRTLRRFPTSLVPDVQAWLDRGISAELLGATLVEQLAGWRRDGEPPKGLKPFAKDLEQALALAKGAAGPAVNGGLSQADDDRLVYLGVFVERGGRDDGARRCWLEAWGSERPRSVVDARAEIVRLEAKRDGGAA